MLSEFGNKHLSDVVNLHYKTLYWTINSKLGKNHIYNLYDTLLKDENSFGYVYIVNDCLVGFIHATMNYNITRKKLLANYKIKDYLKIIQLGIFNPGIMIDLFENKFFIPKFIAKIETNCQTLTLITNPENHLSPFAAVECVNFMKTFFKNKGIKNVFFQVTKYDGRSNRLYERFKFKLLKSYIRNDIYLMEI